VDIPVYPCIECGRPTLSREYRARCDLCIRDYEDLLVEYLLEQYDHLFPARWSELQPLPAAGDGRAARERPHGYDEVWLRHLLDDW
jgi:hypothetical protein